MNRYICRAKRKDNCEWAYGYPARLDYMTNEIFLVGSEFITHRVNQDTICQCIGWNDSNKTPIFEKDIVEFVGPSTDRDLIWWCNEMNMMTAVPLDGIEFNGFDYWNGNYPKYDYSEFCFMMQNPYGDFKEIKVVGNIIDNPELLEIAE